MAAVRRVALGFVTHTGRAAVLALAGPLDAPEVLAKARIDVATTFDEGAVFHVGQELPIAEARALIERSELRFIERARTQLAAFTAPLGAKLVGAGMVAPETKTLPPIEKILKSHALVHAAEGELYRRVFVEAAAAVAKRPTRVPADQLAKRVATALELTAAKLDARLAALGKVSGKPWAADQKQAALVAWLTLLGTRRRSQG
ncbi:MAG TPA: hypothetical protein VK509_16140 [Polyangiales bacterium]|nr:hypothetical protein [Polyangiales bacterium]